MPPAGSGTAGSGLLGLFLIGGVVLFVISRARRSDDGGGIGIGGEPGKRRRDLPAAARRGGASGASDGGTTTQTVERERLESHLDAMSRSGQITTSGLAAAGYDIGQNSPGFTPSTKTGFTSTMQPQDDSQAVESGDTSGSRPTTNEQLVEQGADLRNL